MRGFGIDAAIASETAADVAVLAEEMGYSAFWVNGFPVDAAFDAIEAAAARTDFDLGIGVFSLDRISAEDIVASVEQRGLPQQRMWLGVASDLKPGGLEATRDAVDVLRRDLEVHVMTGAVGPNMVGLSGEIADAAMFTWKIVPEVERSRARMAERAAKAGRPTPPIASYIRCCLMPQGRDALAKRLAFYKDHDNFAPIFARDGVTAEDTVIQGAARDDLLPGIEREEAVVDIPVIRAIPADDSFQSIKDLVEACAPVAS
jgi:alkanesulfonate monooxygenase SsuD/methylene tetrahydromethanopterin reductase-like flavin-dependent oxidoreductase (luciferase family)